MFVIICGAGQLGYSLARRLADENHKVILIEKDKTTCDRVADELPNVIVIHGDACEPRYLEEARVEQAEVVVALTGHDEDNLVICQLAKTASPAPRTIAKVNDPRNEEALSLLGVDIPINATNIIAKVVTQEVGLDEISTLLKLKQGGVAVIQGRVSKDSAASGRALSELCLPPKCTITTILRGNTLIVPKGDTILEAGDSVLAVTTLDAEAEIHQLLTGG
jgi:trk system potassium uptake protein TrkA